MKLLFYTSIFGEVSYYDFGGEGKKRFQVVSAFSMFSPFVSVWIGLGITGVTLEFGRVNGIVQTPLFSMLVFNLLVKSFFLTSLLHQYIINI